MVHSGRRRGSLTPRLEVLEARALLSADALKTQTPMGTDAADSLLVRFADRVAPARVQATLRAVHGHLVEQFPDGPAVVALDPGVDPVAALARLRRNPRVLYAEADGSIQDSAVIPNDPSFTSQWGLNNSNDVDIDAPQAWSVTTGSPGTIVAVLDTGIDLSHPELASRVWVNPGEIPGNGIDDDRDGLIDDVHGWNFDSNTSNVQDDNGHGSHVSGILGAAGNNGIGVAGVDWNARILPLKTLDSRGDGSTDAAVSAVYYAVAHGARVISASWGGADYSQALADAIRYAGTHGVVFVTAAGNESANNDVTRSYPASYRFSNVISVAAVDSSGALASFSNYGATTVDVAGPGVGVLSTVTRGGYASYSGTSMATPFVSGVVALLVAQHPEYSAAQLVQRVLATTKPLPSLAGRTVSGGLVDAAKALGSVGQTAAPTTLASDDAVLANILSSPEYYGANGGTPTGFVSGLYGDLLGRGLDAAGSSFWVGQLQAGASRLAVVQAIQASPEARLTKVARWFRDDLGRAATLDQLKADSGVGRWAAVLASGASDNAVLGGILASGEFSSRFGGTPQGFVSGLYAVLLGRGLDAAGSSLWVGQLQAGASRLAVIQAIQASPEARLTKVAAWYRDDLGRIATLDQLKTDWGVTLWAGLLPTT
jgi:thermitase